MPFQLLTQDNACQPHIAPEVPDLMCELACQMLLLRLTHQDRPDSAAAGSDNGAQTSSTTRESTCVFRDDGTVALPEAAAEAGTPGHAEPC